MPASRAWTSSFLVLDIARKDTSDSLRGKTIAAWISSSRRSPAVVIGEPPSLVGQTVLLCNSFRTSFSSHSGPSTLLSVTTTNAYMANPTPRSAPASGTTTDLGCDLVDGMSSPRSSATSRGAQRETDRFQEETPRGTPDCQLRADSADDPAFEPDHPSAPSIPLF